MTRLVLFALPAIWFRSIPDFKSGTSGISQLARSFSRPASISCCCAASCNGSWFFLRTSRRELPNREAQSQARSASVLDQVCRNAGAPLSSAVFRAKFLLMPEPSQPRAIIHLDMDCFYAAIEVRDRPSLRGKPVGVGGARDRRGVLTTCNYEARAFGVRSAMPTFMALQRCPNLIVLPTRFDVYRKEAGVVREIMHRFTPLVETLSLDEAYLDVTANPRPPGPLAREIRDLIFKETKVNRFRRQSGQINWWQKSPAKSTSPTDSTK